MDSIKKKMQSLATETAKAVETANKFEEEIRRTNDIADGFEDQIRSIQKKMQTMEAQYDVCCENMLDVAQKLETKEKLFASAEADVGGLSRKLLLLEDEVDKSEERLAKAISSLCRESRRADQAVRKRQHLENSNTVNEEQSDILETQLKEARFMLEDSERKFEDISRKMGTLDTELERTNERAEMVENKIVNLEEELKVVGQNLQSLEVSEEKAMLREENYQKQLKEMRERLKIIESRDENATMNIGRLNVKIDQVEESLLAEKMKIKKVSDDLNQTFDDMHLT
ncbi:tropomyosin-2-like [Tigriopus californicus]|uniref:tropomyosin-2-like n=1 Tax=Tigriopus californicus TaxID=6832 RepID=UPI0027DA095A|nr:tropomyosin-2-like [Tigriopus californicus]